MEKNIKNGLDSMKTEIANELGVNLKAENLTAKDAGRVGGAMTKELVEEAKKNLKK